MPRNPSFNDLDATEATIAGKPATSADPYARESETGGGGGDIYGGFGTTLSGSSDPSSPNTGLATAISNAITNGTPFINITGNWTMDGEVSFSSASDTPTIPNADTDVRLPVVLDAWGATIEYAGTGWAITNDNTNNVSGQIDGGTSYLWGGDWYSSGSPNGLFRGIDIVHSEFIPHRTYEWRGGTAPGTEVCRWEVGGRWCESNVFGGFHNSFDIGLRGYDADRTDFNSSFQDNLITDSQMGNTQAYGFYLEGNWIDCTFLNPTVIVSTTDAAAFYHDANMNGTVINGLEIEDAGSNVTHYIAEIGANARDGPLMLGGDDVEGNPFLNITNGDWTWGHLKNRLSKVNVTWYGNRGTPMRYELNMSSEFSVETASDSNSSFSNVMSVKPNGDMIISGSLTENGSP